MRRRVAGIVGSIGVVAGCQTLAVSETPAAPLVLIVGLDPGGALAKRIPPIDEPAARLSDYSRILSAEVGAPLSVRRIASGHDLVVTVNVDVALREMLERGPGIPIDGVDVSLNQPRDRPSPARVVFKLARESRGSAPACVRVAASINEKTKASALFGSSLSEVSTDQCPGLLSAKLDFAGFKNVLIRRLNDHPAIRYAEEDLTVEPQQRPHP